MAKVTEIAEALRAAVLAAGREGDLTVVAIPELDGAIVEACCVQVCVNAGASGFNVECWQRFRGEAYRQATVVTLEDVVRVVFGEFEDV